MKQIHRLFILPLYLALLTLPMHIEASCMRLGSTTLKTALVTLFICGTALSANGDASRSLVEKNDLSPFSDDVNIDASFLTAQSEEVAHFGLEEVVMDEQENGNVEVDYDQDDLLSVLLAEDSQKNAALMREKGIFFDDNWVIIPDDMPYKRSGSPRRLQDDEAEDIAYDTTMSNLELLIRIALIPVGCYIWCCCDRRGKCTPDGDYGMCIVGCDVASVGLEMCSDYVGESSCCQCCAYGCRVITCAHLKCFGLRCCGWCRKSFKRDRDKNKKREDEEDKREEGGNERRQDPLFDRANEAHGLEKTEFFDGITESLKRSYQAKNKTKYTKMEIWRYLLCTKKGERTPIQYLCCEHNTSDSESDDTKTSEPRTAAIKSTSEIEGPMQYSINHKKGIIAIW